MPRIFAVHMGMVDPFFSEANPRRLREAAADMDARRKVTVQDLIEDDGDD